MTRHDCGMSVIRWASEPVRAPGRRVINHYHRFFEDLIHAVKIELVERLDTLDDRVETLDDMVTGSHQVIADQLAMQAASLRSIQTEIERLQDLTRAAARASGEDPPL